MGRPNARLRVGTVPFLVARPLTEGLAEAEGVELEAAPPAVLTRKLREGELDVALASSVLAIEEPDCRFWTAGPVIASRGPVRSVLLFLRPGLCGPHAVERLCTDPRSRTGSALARLLLEQAHGAEFGWEESAPGEDPFAAGADAVQRIGDAAMEAVVDHPEWTAVDLGETWHQLTRLPFVFAGWIGRPGFDPAAAGDVLSRAAESGLARRDRLVEAGAAELGLDRAFLERYLKEDVIYQLPEREVRAALDEFRRRLPPGSPSPRNPETAVRRDSRA